MFSSSTSTSLCKIEKNVDVLFTAYAKHSYRTEVRSRIKKEQEMKNFRFGLTVPPSDEEILDCSPIKLHISIGKDDIARVELDFMQLLLNAISEGIINEFKQTRLDVAYDEYKSANDDLEKINLFKQYLTEEKVNIPADKKEIENEWNEFLLKHGKELYTDKEFLLAMSEQVNQHKIKMLRFIEGSQFTIYLPLKYNLASIARLQNNISKIQAEKKVSGGKMTLAQSSLSALVSLRLEKLDGEYVPAIISDEVTLAKLQKIQTSSELFKYLKLHAGDVSLPFKAATFEIRESSNGCEDPFEIKSSSSHNKIY